MACPLKYLTFVCLLSASLLCGLPTSAQELGYKFGQDKYLSLTQRGNTLSGTITTFNADTGFVHERVSGIVIQQSNTLKMEVPGFGTVAYSRATENLNTVYNPIDKKWPAKELKIKGFTRKTDAVAQAYLDHYNVNTEKRGVPISDLADQIGAVQIACSADANDNFPYQLSGTFCDAWGQPLSVGIVTARKNVGLWEAVAANLDAPTQVRTVDNETAVFVSSPKVLGSVAKATDFKFFDKKLDLRETKVVAGFSSASAASAVFSISPSYMTVRWRIKSGGDFFKLIWNDRSNQTQINNVLSQSAEYFSPHSPSCRYILRNEPRIYCNNTTHDILPRGEKLWIRVGHLLVDIDENSDGTLEFLSLPVFEISYETSGDVPPDTTFSPLKDTVEEELSAAEEAICIWQSGLVQLLGETNVEYTSKVNCS